MNIIFPRFAFKKSNRLLIRVPCTGPAKVNAAGRGARLLVLNDLSWPPTDRSRVSFSEASMLGNRSRPRIPLPKQWPSRVRSGVLHAISLAHFSEDRCGLVSEIEFATPANVPWNVSPNGVSGPLVFDDKLGRLWIPMSSGCRRLSGGPTCVN